MIGTAPELKARLALTRRVLDLSPEPLHVPLGLVFRPLDGASHYRAWEEHAARVRAGTTFAPATIYVNIPFCARICTYCLLSSVRTPGKDFVATYVQALRKQIALFEPIAAGLRFGSLHIGGGTPTLLDERQLDALLTDLSRLPRSEHFQIGVEAHPGTATPGRLAVLRQHGVDRVSFGVESLTPEVLKKVNREDQNEARVRAAVAEAHRLGFSVNVDLLAGLPGETEESWADTVTKALELEPDSMSVNRFLGENSPLARFGYGPDERENLRADRMLMRADAIVRERTPPRWPEEPLDRPGFGTQYVWDRTGKARRYFQDDMIGPVSTLAFGHGALGHVYGQHHSVPAGTLEDFVATLERGQPPDMLVSAVGERYEMAFFVADQACRGELSFELFARVFGRALRAVFGPEVDFLAQQGLLVVHGDRIQKPENQAFQVTHLLTFLLCDLPTLAGYAKALEAAARPGGAPEPGWVRLEDHADLEALVERCAAAGEVLQLDVGRGLDGETATRLAQAGARRQVRLRVRGSERRETGQYGALRTELPPSLLWVRISIRASQSSRGEQRLAIERRG